MNVRDLVPGSRVRVKKAFRDFDRCEHVAGTELTLESHEYFPHDGGHTFRFEGGYSIRLADSDPEGEAVLYDAANEYWELVD